MTGEFTAYIGLGSNLGDRQSALAEALSRLASIDGIRIVAVSPVYETGPVAAQGGDFLNAAAKLRTSLAPEELLQNLHGVEEAMGRVRTEGGVTPRIIDLDLLLFGDDVIATPGLTVPHPRMRDRLFVLAPLADLDPDLEMPDGSGNLNRLLDTARREHPDQTIIRVGSLPLTV